MDKQEAKLLLQALRPKDLNSEQPAVIEALVVVEGDPELKAWWEAQQSFDLKVAAKLNEVPLPADLRDTILTGRKVVQFTPRRLTPRPHFSYLLAAAAVVALLCVAWTFRQISAFGPLAQTEYANAVLPLLHNDAPELAMISPDRDKLVAWLKEQNAPMGALPAQLTALPTVGCQKYVVHGHTVSLICFAMTGGGIAHLFIVDQRALSDPPSNLLPVYNQVLGWSTAAWSDGRMSYMLATQGSPDVLKQLL